MMTQSNRPFFASSSSVRIWSEPSSSDGFGGDVPAVITHSFGFSSATRASSIGA